MEKMLIYSVYDECVKFYNVKDDSQCKMSTAEVMIVSIASAQFFYGNFRRARLILKYGRLMKHVLSESQLNRRWHAIKEELWYAIFFLLAEINKILRPPTKYFAIDSFPLPACEKKPEVIDASYIKEGSF
ncbi:MAG: hypothetical protein VX777_05200 [Chlamydiota bacterium]|nr:hypothetical protein [Chlamydiota bacterium]